MFVLFVLCSINNFASNIVAHINSIPMLNGTNFKPCKEKVMIVLGVMDLDLAFRVARPTDLTEQSTTIERRKMEKWDRSNCMSLMIMTRVIPEAFKGIMSDQVTTAKEFLQEIEKRFAKNENSEISTILANLISMRYKGKGNIREYIMEMSHLTSKLKALKLELPEDLLMHLVLITLPTQFNQFKVNYNYQKDS